MAKFRKGQTITSIIRGTGFEEATILGFVEDRGRKCYRCSIPNGTATIPIVAESNYTLKEK